ncbi:MAG: DUF3108 domain-containing protein [Chitinispirillaceae bacterium]|nr:DUF3108 domain-containing protein [Chitinispirillaceae bacterium]
MIGILRAVYTFQRRQVPFYRWVGYYMRCLIMAIAVIMVLFVIGASSKPVADDTTQEELRWEEASVQVDSFPFTPLFIDSVRKHHKASIPEQPLRVLTEEPFCVPETLVYDVGWGPFQAGYVVLSTMYDSADGAIRVGGKALSNRFVSAFYRMRDYVISTIDARGLYPIFFEAHLREGKRYKANEYILFDNISGKVHIQSRKKFETKEAPSFLHDYLSVLYAIRSNRSLAPGDTFSEWLFVDKKVHSMFFSVKASKPKEVDAGTFPCVLLIPRLVGEGRAFNKKDKLEVWFSDDRRRMPVAIRSKIKFGAINARLKWYNTNHCSTGPKKE